MPRPRHHSFVFASSDRLVGWLVLVRPRCFLRRSLGALPPTMVTPLSASASLKEAVASIGHELRRSEAEIASAQEKLARNWVDSWRDWQALEPERRARIGLPAKLAHRLTELASAIEVELEGAKQHGAAREGGGSASIAAQVLAQWHAAAEHEVPIPAPAPAPAPAAAVAAAAAAEDIAQDSTTLQVARLEHHSRGGTRARESSSSKSRVLLNGLTEWMNVCGVYGAQSPTSLRSLSRCVTMLLLLQLHLAVQGVAATPRRARASAARSCRVTGRPSRSRYAAA